jgi:predicted transcriptional regulator
MSQERLPMRKIREVLRLKAEGLSKRRIAASLGISATAALECLQGVRRAGLSWPLPDGLDEQLDLIKEMRSCSFPEARCSMS